MEQQILCIGIGAVVIGLMVRAYFWMRDGGQYYKAHPGAKLLDDLAKAGQLDAATAEQVIHRVGSAKNQHEAVAEIRKEVGLNTGKK